MSVFDKITLSSQPVLDEPGGETPWLLWMLADGWSQSDHGQIAACPAHQSDPLLRIMRFADSR